MKALKFKKDDSKTITLDSSNWTSEYDMWKSFHFAVVVTKGKFQGDLSLTDEQLKDFAITQLKKNCKTEILIFIKNFPSTKSDVNYNQIVLCIAALGELVTNCWKELESIHTNALGKVAIVIESSIAIPKLSVETEEANFLLSVEPLTIPKQHK